MKRILKSTLIILIAVSMVLIPIDFTWSKNQNQAKTEVSTVNADVPMPTSPVDISLYDTPENYVPTEEELRNAEEAASSFVEPAWNADTIMAEAEAVTMDLMLLTSFSVS